MATKAITIKKGIIGECIHNKPKLRFVVEPKVHFSERDGKGCS